MFVPPDPTLVPATTAAVRLGLTTAQVYRMIDAGQLAAQRDERGRIHVSAEDVDRIGLGG